jgi:hypothetical protein
MPLPWSEGKQNVFVGPLPSSIAGLQSWHNPLLGLYTCSIPVCHSFPLVHATCTLQAVLAEKGKCPFTGQPLTWHQCTMLTHANIQRFRDRIRD